MILELVIPQPTSLVFAKRLPDVAVVVIVMLSKVTYCVLGKVTVTPVEVRVVLPRPCPLNMMVFVAEAPVILAIVIDSVKVAAETVNTTGPLTPFV